MPKLNENKNCQKISSFVDFIPAELRSGKDWIIVYYAKNPVSNKLERQRLRVPKIKNQSERLRFAKKTIVEINNKLLSGWSPYFNQAGKSFKSWSEAIKDFKNNMEKMYKDKSLRYDSHRTYKSNLSLLEQYIAEKKIKITFAIEFNKSFCFNYLDWIYLERKNSPRTRNNHLIFLRLLGNYFLQRGILAENPTNGIKNLAKQPKKRIYIPKDVRLLIKNEIANYPNGSLAICETIYYCFIRNTELSKMRVKFVDLENYKIFIPAEISKNKKDEFVTIPEEFKNTIAKHIFNADPEDYLFSNNGFLPGEKPLSKKRIWSFWIKLQKKLNFAKEYQFYSLKDTGITDLFLLGLPALAIKNQARHSSVQITELYTPDNMSCNELVKNAKNNF